MVDDGLQFLGQGAIEYLFFALPVEFKAAAVEEKPVQAKSLLYFAVQGKITVAGVAQKRVTDACEVCADLMHAAGFQLDFDQIVTDVMLLHAVVGDGFFGVLVVLPHLHLAALGGIGASQLFADGSLVFRKVSLDECEVVLVHFVFANHAG